METKTDEKAEAEETKTEVSKEDTNTGDEPKRYQHIDDANLAAKRLEEANKERKELLDREEKLYAEQKLAGVSGSATQQKKEVSEDQKKVNNASEFFKDTALGDAIKKTNE